MFFWNSLALSMIQWQFDLWLLPKSSLNTVHVLMKPGLENFDHYFTSVWDECNCAVFWAFFGITFLWHYLSLGLEWKLTFSSPLATAEFPNLPAYWVQHFTASSFRIWNSSTGVLSPPLALFIVMLPKPHLTSYSRMFGCRWVITPWWLSGAWKFS